VICRKVLKKLWLVVASCARRILRLLLLEGLIGNRFCQDVEERASYTNAIYVTSFL
jgi:hypothetical protein